MVDGYVWEIGKIGVCCSIIGFGVINFIIGIVFFYSDYVLILVITG